MKENSKKFPEKKLYDFSTSRIILLMLVISLVQVVNSKTVNKEEYKNFNNKNNNNNHSNLYYYNTIDNKISKTSKNYGDDIKSSKKNYRGPFEVSLEGNEEQQEKEKDKQQKLLNIKTTKHHHKYVNKRTSFTTDIGKNQYNGINAHSNFSQFKRSLKQGFKGQLYQNGNKRRKRQSGLETGTVTEPDTSVAGGIYTKNDPLKSYYDFVIVEASHKFWSIFELTTAIIVIYSIFTALYYSKMNPLVSKHDYVDYIGGEDYMGGGRGRTLDEDDDDDNDFVDDIDDVAEKSNWFSKSGHSIKFILEAIDKVEAMDESSTSL